MVDLLLMLVHGFSYVIWVKGLSQGLVTPCSDICLKWHFVSVCWVIFPVIHFSMILRGDKVAFGPYFTHPLPLLPASLFFVTSPSCHSFWPATLYWVLIICRARFWLFHIRNFCLLLTVICWNVAMSTSSAMRKLRHVLSAAEPGPGLVRPLGVQWRGGLAPGCLGLNQGFTAPQLGDTHLCPWFFPRNGNSLSHRAGIGNELVNYL